MYDISATIVFVYFLVKRELYFQGLKHRDSTWVPFLARTSLIYTQDAATYCTSSVMGHQASFTALYRPCQQISISQQQTVKAKPWEAKCCFRLMPCCDLWCIYHKLGWLWPRFPGHAALRSSISCQLHRSAAPFPYMPPAERAAVPCTFAHFTLRWKKGGEKVSGLVFPWHSQSYRVTSVSSGDGATQILFLTFICIFKNWPKPVAWPHNSFSCMCLWILHKLVWLRGSRLWVSGSILLPFCFWHVLASLRCGKHLSQSNLHSGEGKLWWRLAIE